MYRHSGGDINCPSMTMEGGRFRLQSGTLQTHINGWSDHPINTVVIKISECNSSGFKYPLNKRFRHYITRVKLF